MPFEVLPQVPQRAALQNTLADLLFPLEKNFLRLLTFHYSSAIFTTTEVDFLFFLPHFFTGS